MKHIYCFVDESGQDTRGGPFVLAVVTTEDNVEFMRLTCKRIEQETGKGAKWIKTRYERRLAYARQVLAEPA
jgi:hypothetical protein